MKMLIIFHWILLWAGIQITLCERSCRNGLPTNVYPPTVKNTTELLNKLRKLMKVNNVQGYIIPSTDDHRNEYVSERYKRVKFISGYKGSTATIVVTDTKAAIWVDGRYHDQVDTEVDCNWTPQKWGLPNVTSWAEWVKQELQNKSIGVDPRLISIARYKSLLKQWRGFVTWKSVEENLVDKIWTDRPKPTHNKVYRHPLKYTGLEYTKKLDNLRKELKKKKVQSIVVQALDDVAWLLNLRGWDIPFTPFFFSYIIVTMDTLTLYVDTRKIDEIVRKELCKPELPSEYCVSIKNYDYSILGNDLKNLVKKNKEKIWIDSSSSVFVGMNIPEDRQYEKPSPIQLPKAMKNEVELEGMKKANMKDGISIMEYFVWLKDQVNSGKKVTEMSGQEQLKEFKSRQDGFVDLSFQTISGFGSNAAIIHYTANKFTDKEITDKSVYLLDCGSQFPEGSTDITRTIHLGDPTAKQKEMYTYVLQGAISLANLVFPNGVYGGNIDAFARRALWEKGLDYRHGTGHGIGSFLSIHEGPGRIGTGRTYSTESTLNEGMVFSDEPGYYESGDFGIRLESAIYVKPAKRKYKMKGTKFYEFGILTYVPFAKNLIDVSLLSVKEINWLNRYNAEIREFVGPQLLKQNKKRVYDYMMEETEPLELEMSLTNTGSKVIPTNYLPILSYYIVVLTFYF